MPQDVTQLLQAISNGRDSSVSELLPLVYDELRCLADNFLGRERSDHTLQATALVHEVYLKLVDQHSVRWQDRAHFFGIAAQAIRRILVDHARSHGRAKRGGGQQRIALDSQAELAPEPDADLLALDDALQRLSEVSPSSIRVVEMRYFGGMTIDETAAALGISNRTVEREWCFARTWLYRELGGDPTTPRTPHHGGHNPTARG